MLRQTLVIGLLILPLISCATLSPAPTPTSATREAVCAEVKIVKLSRTDTLETINAVRKNNAALRALCGEEAPVPVTP